MTLHGFQRFLDHGPQRGTAANLILDNGRSNAQIQDRQHLAIIRHECLPNIVLSIVTSDQGLQYLESLHDDFAVSCIESRLDGDDELGQHRQHPPSLAHLHHVVDAPLCQKGVRFLHLP